MQHQMQYHQQMPVGAGASYAPPMTKVELNLSAMNLRDRDVMSKSDPLCILYIKERGQNSFIEVGRTEQVVNSLNPQWVKKFELDYRFEERQCLKFDVFDWDTKSSNPKDQDSLGHVECTLAEIMACQGSQFKKNLAGGGTFIVSGEEISGVSKEVITLNVSAKNLDKKDFMGKSDPYLVFSKSLANNSFSAVHKTEIVKNNLNPIWKPIIIPLRSLCGTDENRPIKIECYDWDSDGSHDLIGEFQTTVKKLKEGPGPHNTYTFMNPKKQKKSSYKGSGQFVLHNCTTHIEPTFLDYIRGGLQLHFTVAVDFTASNGDPRNSSSLHYKQPGVDNQYSLAIKAVGEIIQDYDTDKMFPALGFGARLPPTWNVSHEFFLNGSTDNPYCQGLQGILDAYNYSLQTVGLYGPTNFSPVIRHVSQFARSIQDGSSYFVLLIITDGIITDLNETKKTLVEASSLPMSVIIIGVGNEDFSSMELLDADNKRLCYEGRYAERDIVQFVEFRRHLAAGNAVASKMFLAKDVLAEVPLQLQTYMKRRNISPKPPTLPPPLNQYGVE